MSSRELEARRQLARRVAERAYGVPLHYTEAANAVDGAIQSATRVEITEDVIEAYGDAYREAPSDWERREEGLKAAFEAAGFEVVE